MNIAICEDRAEDNAILRSYIESYCEKNCFAAQISCFESGEALLSAFCPGGFDLIFLDIFLPGLSGVETARKIRETDRDSMLVFITVSDEYTLEGFEVNAGGYVIKPISRERMDRAMHACRVAFEHGSRTTEIPYAGGSVGVTLSELLYAEVYNKESVLHMKKGEITARIPLDELETRLGGLPFLRCHRSYLVNLNHVADMRENDFLMTNGDAVPIRVNGRKEVRMAVVAFMASSFPEVV